MNKTQKFPVLYSFGFLKEFAGLPDGPKRNMFQFKIHHAFGRFIKQSLQSILDYGGDYTEAFRKDFSALISGQTSFGDFSCFLGKNEESIYINFIVPPIDKGSKEVYLEKQVHDLRMLFSFLYYGSYVFMETEEGNEYRRVTFYDQPFTPVLLIGKEYFLSFQIEGELFRKLKQLLCFANEKTKVEVKEAVNSILSHDTFLQKQTEVSLGKDYVQIQVYGEHCCLISDFSGQHDYNKTFVLATKHVDSPLQMMALLAATGCLFHLTETKN